MKTKRLDGALLEAMLKNGLANLRAHEKEVNEMNVFPVPDGDTGVNMRLTLENGIRAAEPDGNLGAYLKKVCGGMLLGARGNSGVILSQLFAGLCQSLQRDGIVNVGEMTEALISAYKVAYRAVEHPVEGTMLTVAREGIEKIRSQVDRSTTFETLFSMYVAEMRKSLAFTPEVLPVLKEAGVVDSGATGYIYIAEGMLRALYGETAEAAAPALPEETGSAPVDLSAFNAESEFTYGYCMEFLLQRMKGEEYSSRFRLEEFVGELRLLGDSLVALEDGDRVKVHIHTKKPARIITACQQYGEFLTFKLENMQLQHNGQMAVKAGKLPHKPVATVAVVNGEGARTLLTELGCDIVIEGGATMNVSAQEFVNALRRVDADRVVILPDNKNTVRTAEQAVSLAGAENAIVLPTGSVAEAYFALAMDVADEEDVDRRVSAMRRGAEEAATVSLAVATKAYSSGSVSCEAGDIIALCGGELVHSGKTLGDALRAGLARVPGIEEKESALVLCGSAAKDDQRAELEEAFAACCPEIEPNFVDGGQDVLLFVIGL